MTLHKLFYELEKKEAQKPASVEVSLADSPMLMVSGNASIIHRRTRIIPALPCEWIVLSILDLLIDTVKRGCYIELVQLHRIDDLATVKGSPCQG